MGGGLLRESNHMGGLLREEVPTHLRFVLLSGYLILICSFSSC